MVEKRDREFTPAKNRTTVERSSERELVVTRTFEAPARLVFEAWSRPELLKQWWVPKSMGMALLSLEADVRTGGRYRFVFRHEGSTMEFFGKYLEVVPPSRIVWTNEESGEGGSVTTVTFEETGGRTRLVMRDVYPSKEALDAAGTGAGRRWHPKSFRLRQRSVHLRAVFLCAPATHTARHGLHGRASTDRDPTHNLGCQRNSRSLS